VRADTKREIEQQELLRFVERLARKRTDESDRRVMPLIALQLIDTLMEGIFHGHDPEYPIKHDTEGVAHELFWEIREKVSQFARTTAEHQFLLYQILLSMVQDGFIMVPGRVLHQVIHEPHIILHADHMGARAPTTDEEHPVGPPQNPDEMSHS
jgi:hypothetical protein